MTQATVATYLIEPGIERENAPMFYTSLTTRVPVRSKDKLACFLGMAGKNRLGCCPSITFRLFR